MPPPILGPAYGSAGGTEYVPPAERVRPTQLPVGVSGTSIAPEMISLR